MHVSQTWRVFLSYSAGCWPYFEAACSVPGPDTSGILPEVMIDTSGILPGVMIKDRSIAV
jgi:hypothetical protein